jgi:hemin uptake protein HemP
MSKPVPEIEDREDKDMGRPREPRVLDAQQLLAGEKEVRILHAGVPYRLRVTRRGRLILTK